MRCYVTRHRTGLGDITTEACLDMLCDNDEPYQLLGMFRSWKWDREAQIITRAYEDLPTYVRVARHMARHGQR